MLMSDFYKKYPVAYEVRSKLSSAMKAYVGLITRLQADGYIKPGEEMFFSEVLMKEQWGMISSLVMEVIQKPDLPRIIYPLLSDIYESSVRMSYEEFLLCVTDITKRRKSEENTEEIMQAFGVLCRFDQMAQEYSGAFYQRMGVENPGRLTELYLQIIEAVEFILKELVTEVSGEKQSRELFSGLVSEFTGELKKMELECLE